MTNDLIDRTAAIIYNCNHRHNDWESLKQVSREVDSKYPNTDLQREYRSIIDHNQRAAAEIISLLRGVGEIERMRKLLKDAKEVADCATFGIYEEHARERYPDLWKEIEQAISPQGAAS